MAAAPSLQEIANRIQQYPGVTRKRRIGAFTSHFPSIPGVGIVAAFGEDCAVLELPELKEDYLLFAADAIMPDILRSAPRYAGYASVLVNVLDIVAKAGTPIAIVDFLGSTGAAFESEVAEGMKEAIDHFQVPLVGGHLHPDDPSPALAVAILGRVPKRLCLFSHTAQIGDEIVVAADLDGKRGAEYPMAWSPLRHKNRVQIQQRFQALREAASRGYIRASKDASIPGIVGTAGMLLESSGAGGVLDLDRIPRPASVALEDWLLMYQGCGFVLTASSGDVPELVAIMSEHGLTAASAGEVIPASRLDIVRGRGRETVFDFAKGGVTGIGPVAQ